MTSTSSELNFLKEIIDIPRDHLPDPEAENLPSSIGFPQESTADLDKRWSDTGIDRIPLKFQKLKPF
ncbi:unnamed protein product [Thelazia callipaeda]|uniref:Anaphase-promoting complex subunit 13 n=1 Tax=Thelazia callipaeda TaxID=103827 RepID=A0A0N5D891_THECL|nr:unnamed protein product [Thelazia callipaeda]